MSASVKTTRRLLGALAALLALGAGRAGAQAPRPAAERLAGRLDAGTRAQVLTLVDSAGREGLPVEPLVDKALEGASKGAPSARIVSAVRTLATSLERSRAILGPDASDADVLAGANALRQGASPELLRRLREQRLRGGMTVALGVLTELSARGAPADVVARALVALDSAGASEVQLAEFGRDVQHDIASGIASPVTAVATRTESFLVGTATDDRSGGARGGSAPKKKP